MIDDIKKNIQFCMNKVINILTSKVNTLRTGRASPNILENIKVEYYGNITMLKYLANIVVEDYKTLKIIIFDSTLSAAIKKAIIASDLGLNPSTSSENVIYVILPPLTEERRKNLIKILHNCIEDGKIGIRNLRREANEKIKLLLKNKHISKDDEFYGQNEIQLLTDKYIEKINDIFIDKKNEILKF